MVSVWQLNAVGLGRNAVTIRVAAGRLHRLHQGIYAVGHSALSNEARWMAAVLACGQARNDLDASSTETVLDHWGAALSYRSACELWGLLSPGGGPSDISRLCRRCRLPVPEVNVRIGPHLVDFLWRERRLVVETDGYASHRGRAAFEDDRARDLDLRARGFDVLRLAEKQIEEDTERVAEVVATALRVGADAPGSL